MFRGLFLVLGIFAFLWSLVDAKQAQFYQKGQNYGFALSTNAGSNGTDYYMALVAPQGFGWAAVGSGNKMDNSVMFIIYPSGDDNGKSKHNACHPSSRHSNNTNCNSEGITLSVRSTT